MKEPRCSSIDLEEMAYPQVGKTLEDQSDDHGRSARDRIVCGGYIGARYQRKEEEEADGQGAEDRSGEPRLRGEGADLPRGFGPVGERLGDAVQYEGQVTSGSLVKVEHPSNEPRIFTRVGRPCAQG